MNNGGRQGCVLKSLKGQNTRAKLSAGKEQSAASHCAGWKEREEIRTRKTMLKDILAWENILEKEWIHMDRGVTGSGYAIDQAE